MSGASCKHFKVTGHVQGVAFRAATQRQARSLNLTGWVKNCPDGSVEVLACGTPYDLDDLEAWLHIGPSLARVEEVITEESEWEDLDDFEIR